ncbi:unnamed protein product [Timema podura]|uniref:Uncharacterized protein n=1 Tax=Timema podura TaxID=61482 RepID=A0ABN7NZ22_TIMPD|nr:unnamed protein product [Timema podura]
MNIFLNLCEAGVLLRSTTARAGLQIKLICFGGDLVFLSATTLKMKGIKTILIFASMLILTIHTSEAKQFIINSDTDVYEPKSRDHVGNDQSELLVGEDVASDDPSDSSVPEDDDPTDESDDPSEDISTPNGSSEPPEGGSTPSDSSEPSGEDSTTDSGKPETTTPGATGELRLHELFTSKETVELRTHISRATDELRSGLLT